MKKLYSFIIVASLLFGFTTLNSCNGGGDEQEYQVRVRVVNPDGVRVHNAEVLFFTPVVPSLIEEVGYSSTDGEVVFKYDNKAFADIRAQKGGWSGCNSVELFEGREVQVTVIIVPPDLEEQNRCLDR